MREVHAETADTGNANPLKEREHGLMLSCSIYDKGVIRSRMKERARRGASRAADINAPLVSTGPVTMITITSCEAPLIAEAKLLLDVQVYEVEPKEIAESDDALNSSMLRTVHRSRTSCQYWANNKFSKHCALKH